MPRDLRHDFGRHFRTPPRRPAGLGRLEITPEPDSLLDRALAAASRLTHTPPEVIVTCILVDHLPGFFAHALERRNQLRRLIAEAESEGYLPPQGPLGS